MGRGWGTMSRCSSPPRPGQLRRSPPCSLLLVRLVAILATQVYVLPPLPSFHANQIGLNIARSWPGPCPSCQAMGEVKMVTAAGEARGAAEEISSLLALFFYLFLIVCWSNLWDS